LIFKIFPTQEIGSLKKPSWLVKQLKDKNISKEEKAESKDDLAYLNIKILEDLGLDFVYDGEARRVEMYEYSIKNIKGFQFCGNVRSWDNKYYRKARCIDRLGYKNNYHLDEFLFVKKYARKQIKVPITGPYTLADWSYNEFYQNKNDLVFDLAKEVIRPLIKDLTKAGANIIQLDEPAVTTNPQEIDLFVNALNETTAGIQNKINIHICYSGDNYQTLFPSIFDLNANQFMLEFANRDKQLLGIKKNIRNGYNWLRIFKEYNEKRQIGLGVVDVHTDYLEPPELIRDRILYSNSILEDPKLIYVNPDCGLRTRSRKVALNKLRNMVKGAFLAREEIGK
jgi:5-methyltetrahydropteroyltriglutamate--homocysteine methyltransferase